MKSLGEKCEKPWDEKIPIIYSSAISQMIIVLYILLTKLFKIETFIYDEHSLLSSIGRQVCY